MHQLAQVGTGGVGRRARRAPGRRAGVATLQRHDEGVEAAVAGRATGRWSGSRRSRRSRRTGTTAGSARSSGRARRAAPRPRARAARPRGSPCRRPRRRRPAGVIRRRSSATHPGVPVAAGGETARRPTYRRRRGRSATWSSAHQRTTAATSSWEAGRTTASGASLPSPARILSRSGVDLPRVRAMRHVVVGVHVLVADEVARARRACSSARPTSGSRTSVRGHGGAVLEGAEEGLDELAHGLRSPGAPWRGRPSGPSASAEARSRVDVRHVIQCDT